MVKLVQQYFSEFAKKCPNKPAVDVWHEEKSDRKAKGIKYVKNALEMSFGQLEEYSNRLARYLKGQGISRGDRVALMFMKTFSVDAIASILAILKCDAVYVPISHTLPEERIIKILNDSGAKLMTCDTKFPDFQFIELNYPRRNLVKNESSEPFEKYENDSGDIAYIMYTSGSTGIPKGVQITHANIINATDWAVEEFDITSKDKISQHPPLNFDLSTFDLYCAFKAGATLYPVVDNLSLFPGDLLRMIEESEITIWNSVPSVMVYLWNSGLVKPNRIPTVNKIFFNGEGFPAKYLDGWKRTFPDKEFINMYGPTETTVQCTFYRIPKGPLEDLTKLVPIGKACRDVEVFAVKDDGLVALPGEEGELYVAGRGVSPGYWNDLEKTEKSFIHDPRSGKTGRVYKTGDLVKLREDGNYEFIGRKDNQVKVHGNRIELGDIDQALLSLSYVKEAATIAVPDESTGGNKLAAFVDLKDEKAESYIKKDLDKLIPNYMVPNEILFAKLPRTGTGKVDRLQLKEIYESQRKIKTFLEKETQRKINDYSENLIDNGLLDSFSMIKLISFIEGKFNLKIDMEELSPGNFNSVNKIAKFINQSGR